MDWNKLWRKLIFIPGWLMIVLSIFSAAALVAVFVKGWDSSPIAYAIYVIAFYTLCTVTVFFVMVLPGKYKLIKGKVLSNPFGNRYVTDKAYRTKISLYLSLGTNLSYAAMNILFWYLYHSWWFACLAVYYIILSLMRFLLVRYVRINEIGKNLYGELKRSLICSCILLLLNLFLAGAVLMMAYQNRGYEYHGILIYVMALYTFYTATMAIKGLITYRRFGSPVMSTARGISVIAALVSVLNLETAMFAEFGADMSRENQQLMIMLTGAGISIAIVGIALFAIIRCAKKMKQMRCP